MRVLYIIYLQSSVLGDLKVEAEGETIWDSTIGIIIGIGFLYLLFRGMTKEK